MDRVFFSGNGYGGFGDVGGVGILFRVVAIAIYALGFAVKYQTWGGNLVLVDIFVRHAEDSSCEVPVGRHSGVVYNSYIPRLAKFRTPKRREAWGHHVTSIKRTFSPTGRGHKHGLPRRQRIGQGIPFRSLGVFLGNAAICRHQGEGLIQFTFGSAGNGPSPRRSTSVDDGLSRRLVSTLILFEAGDCLF